ncbi:GC-rich sequence DNA-binding factor-like protein-domain-containing protein [Syncephalis plumigaleata]|nr:GC-rich sequence DNA-binding factor-like protein-domain-containing protein [Syncephalis plumigaleata]
MDVDESDVEDAYDEGSRMGLGISTQAMEEPQHFGLGMSSQVADIPMAFGSSSKRDYGFTSERGKKKGSDRKQNNHNRSRNGNNDGEAHTPDWTKHTTGIGAKLMMKMGHVPGTGLGESGQGIVRPIETKIRPGRVGIAFGGFKEKTAQAREDELRRGLSVSDSEEEMDMETRGKSKKSATAEEIPGWMKKSTSSKVTSTKSRKSKTVYRTMDEVIALVERETAQQQQTKVVDYTGPQVRTITSTNIRSTPTGQAASMRFMELRHNLDLLTDMARNDVARCGKEKRLITAQYTEADTECTLLESRMEQQQKDTEQMKQVIAIVALCQAETSTEIESIDKSILVYEEHLANLHSNYVKEYTQLALDRFAVALFVPLMRHELVDWHPIEEPERMLNAMIKWQPYMKETASVAVVNHENNDHRWSMPVSTDKKPNRAMSAYESMMYHLWLPRVRSALNNDWNPREPDGAVNLLDKWKPLMPQFIFDTLCQHVLLPKLHRAINDWDPRRDPLWTAIRHAYAVVLKDWHPSDISALETLLPWQGVFQSVDMDSLLTSSIIPKLTMALRVEFEVNPQQQDLAPLEWVLSWSPLLSTTTIAQLLEQEFFPKWLEILSLWLQSKPNYDEVTEWYMYWKNLEHPRVQDGFRQGLDLMNQMIA